MERSIQANGEKILLLRNRTAAYFKSQGRRPRILIPRISPDGSERTVKNVAAVFASIGFDVDIHLPVQASAHVARMAVEDDVHAIGIPCVTSESEPFLTELLTSLEAECDQAILVVVWTSIHTTDIGAFFKSGTGNFRIFGPETDYRDSAGRILDHLEGQ